MVGISLTSSMRSNLQSLQAIAGSQNVVQNRLATGLKVSSAIDNAGSFYTAKSLNNRSADLGALLDSMSQGIQTIKNASQTLTMATKMLEQAKALATQTLDKIHTFPPIETGPISKEWLIENGVKAENIVNTKAELIARMATAQAGDRIVVWGKIEMGDDTLTMKDGVKLVGAEHVIRETKQEDYLFVEDGNKGKITFNKTTNANGIIVGNNTELSDLNLELATVGKSAVQGLIYNNGKTITLRNLDLKQTDNTTGNNSNIGAIMNNGSAITKLEGIINIETGSTGLYNHGIMSFDNTAKNIQATNSELNIITSGSNAYGIQSGTNNLAGYVNVTTSGSYAYGIANGTNSLSGKINITTSGSYAYGIANGINSLSGNINITTLGSYGYGIVSGTNELSGNVNISTSGTSGYGIANGTNTLKGSLKLLIETKDSNSSALFSGKYNWENGAKVGFKNHDGSINALWQAPSAGTATIPSSTGVSDFSQPPFSWNTIGVFPGIPAQTVIANINAREIPKQVRDDSMGVRGDSIGVWGDSMGVQNYKLGDNNKNIIFNLTKEYQQYSSLLAQFNNLIKDSSYKGINLLLEQNMVINFNEDRSSNILVKGVDASAQGLGLETTKWNNREDIEKSIAELDASINKLRGFSEEFGNYYSIVSTREDFTNSIINVLSEGADKLTLADMNQESANMLSLQTRQQLAVNSLSLASQAAQSVLKLF